MHRYRIYLLDSHNLIANAYDFEGADDLSALDKANQIRESQAAEIWDRTRVVARIDRDGEAGQAPSWPSAANANYRL